jgi:SOS response regulatory protein OraA/RecX
VFDALARKGFSFSAIREALKSYIEELEDTYV